ncbi:N-acetylmuramic acid 6-phosphate etherase [Aeromicrobium ginsengisoli]|uniref:N-acetylmuramic acid 6-phosphate etherase n=1 Tax=Aeromicrobium ginsengisoli TaxID=363867 RepID=UPI001CB6E688|nr:N-acetylmuramic acid 6-phosphate etherase [Aeromicrobium ginsengisoli]
MADLVATEERNASTLDLDLRTSREVIEALMREDAVAVRAAQRVADDLAMAVDRAHERTSAGGRIHYFGAGASGRLAVLDATEATPTFGTPQEFFTAHFPGGREAFMDSRIDREDAEQLGHDDAAAVMATDVAIGITASGSTSYVRGALRRAREAGALTVLITANPAASLAAVADVTVAPDTGAEALTGSTRLKAGTATKVVLNAFSTALMVRSGRTYSNLMVCLVATNDKLRQRAVSVLEMATSQPREVCVEALDRCEGDLSTTLVHLLSGRSPAESREALARGGSVRAALGMLR